AAELVGADEMRVEVGQVVNQCDIKPLFYLSLR
ncbi:uncharacterized, partial [Tachysurus ichikawai]